MFHRQLKKPTMDANQQDELLLVALTNKSCIHSDIHAVKPRRQVASIHFSD